MMGLLLLLLHPGQRNKSACMYPSSPQSSLLLYSCRLQNHLLLQYQTVRCLYSRIRFHLYFLRIYFLQIYFPQNCFRCCLHQRFLPFQTLPDSLPDQSFLPFRRNFHFQNFPLRNFLLRHFRLQSRSRLHFLLRIRPLQNYCRNLLLRLLPQRCAGKWDVILAVPAVS